VEWGANNGYNSMLRSYFSEDVSGENEDAPLEYGKGV